MKREIKFRAWDKDMKEMVFVSGIQFDPHSPKEKPNIIDERNDIRDLDDIELMQFTGLKDKNGKEVYESDIVKYMDYNEAGEVEFNDVVEYHEGAFYPVCERPSNEFEVIGNIYENPE